MPSTRTLFGALGLIAIAIAFGLFRYLGSSSPLAIPEGLKPIGEITAISGSVEHRWPSRVEFLPVAKSGGVLHIGELVRTNVNSQAVIALNNGTQLKIAADSQFVAEADATREGAIRGTIVSGNVEITKPGTSFALYREGKEVTQGRRIETIVIPSSDPSAQSLATPNEPVVTAMTPAEVSTPTPPSTPSSTDQPVETGSLTNDEIRKSFAKNAGFFQRCYLSHLSRKGMSGAHSVTVGFSIQPSGKITGTKIVRSDFDDSTLNNCVVEAIERTSLRPFSGAAIEILEFPVELN